MATHYKTTFIAALIKLVFLFYSVNLAAQGKEHFDSQYNQNEIVALDELDLNFSSKDYKSWNTGKRTSRCFQNCDSLTQPYTKSLIYAKPNYFYFLDSVSTETFTAKEGEFGAVDTVDRLYLRFNASEKFSPPNGFYFHHLILVNFKDAEISFEPDQFDTLTIVNSENIQLNIQAPENSEPKTDPTPRLVNLYKTSFKGDLEIDLSGTKNRQVYFRECDLEGVTEMKLAPSEGGYFSFRDCFFAERLNLDLDWYKFGARP